MKKENFLKEGPELKKIKLATIQDSGPTTSLENETIVEFEKPISKISPLPDVISEIESCSEQENDDESDDDSIDISDLPPPDKVKFLPRTIDGLRKQFNKLFCEFWREKKYKHRNELVFLLDELLRKSGITLDTYKQVNNLLAQSLGSDIEDEETSTEENRNDVMDKDDEVEEEEQVSEEDKLKTEISSTTDYLIEHDKKELKELLDEFQTEDELKKLIDVYIENEFVGQMSIMNDIKKSLNNLSSSRNIPKSKLHRINMLLNEIGRNRDRIETILKCMSLVFDSGDDNVIRTLQQLLKEELLSDEQYFKLADMVCDLNLAKLISVIKETKVGQGMSFLPRKTSDLLDKLGLWLEELGNKGESIIRNKLSSVLDELLRRKVITREHYETIKEENNII